MTLLNDKPTVEVPNLVKPLYECASKRRKVYRCRSNRASAIGGDCERQLVYERTHWQEKELHDVDLELIFGEGNIQEEATMRALADAGIHVIEQQRPLSWDKYNITGHVDGVIAVNGKAVLLEIKSMADSIWRSIFRDGPRAYLWEEVDASFTAKPWLRKYYPQLQVYLLCKETENAILLCKNKSTGAFAQVNIELDYEVAEAMVQRAERINAHVAVGTYPERIAWDADTCGRCPFLHICQPDRVNKDPIQFVEDEEAAKTLDQRGEAQEASRAYKIAHEWVIDWAWKRYPDKPTLTVGNWLIEKRTGKGGRRLTTIKRVTEVDQ